MVEKTSHAVATPPGTSRSHWLESTRQSYARQPLLFSLGVALVVLLVDYLSGRAIRFPLIYAIPVGLAAWRHKRAAAYGQALLLPAVRLVFDLPWHTMKQFPIDVLNLPIAALSLSLYAYLIDRTSRQTLELHRRVRKLEGILDICASCKRIKNADGAYEQLEAYITDHSEAVFSHGLCPDCLPKYF